MLRLGFVRANDRPNAQAAFAETGSKAIGLATIPFFFFFSTTNIASFTCIGQLCESMLSHAKRLRGNRLTIQDIVEINPYALRSRAMSLNIFAQGVAFSFNQYVNPIALDAIGELRRDRWGPTSALLTYLSLEVLFCLHRSPDFPDCFRLLLLLGDKGIHN